MSWCANPLCGKTLGLEEHHIVHRSHLGTDEPENRILICGECHRRHHDLGTLEIASAENGVLFTDMKTGEIRLHRRVAQEAERPSELTTAAVLVIDFLDLSTFVAAIQQEPDEVLATLYGQMREIKQRVWQVQAAIIAELQERANYGDEATQGIAGRLNTSPRTVQYRGKIYREILSHPESADVSDILTEESWYREAVDTKEPRRWIKHAADRKAEDVAYSLRKFRAEIAAETGDAVSLTSIILVCREGNAADQKLAQKLEASLRVSVSVVVTEKSSRFSENALHVVETEVEDDGYLAYAPASQSIIEHRPVSVVHAA